MSIYQLISNTGKGITNTYGNKQRNEILYNPYKGKANNISVFYNDFIEKRLPDINVVKRWHEMLVEYCEMPGAVFAIRGGNTAGSLRRGWLTKTNQDYSFFFTDNDLATIIYKIVLDDYCPSKEEFYEFMTKFDYPEKIPWLSKNKTIPNLNYQNNQKRKFSFVPAHFGKYGGKTYPDKHESEQNAFIINGPVCCLGSYGYKHSHIFNAGTGYCINGNTIGFKEIEGKYFTLGKIEDYKWDSSLGNYVRNNYYIPDDKKDEYKSLIIACFLRFVDPINHFLAPSTKGKIVYIDTANNIKKDIAEYVPLLDYIKTQYEIRFNKNYYKDFMKKVLAENNYTSTTGTTIIDAIYDSKSKKASTSTTTPIVTVNKKVNVEQERNQVSEKIGQYAKRIFTEIIENNTISKDIINKLKDKKYCKENFGISYALLVENGVDTFEKERYYQTHLVLDKYLICSQWYKKNRKKLDTWLKNQNALITPIGKYCKNIFIKLLEQNKLNSDDIINLQDKAYCHDNFNIYFPLIVDKNTANYDSKRFYKKPLVLDKYLICSQWYEYSRQLVDKWLKEKGYKI